MEFFFPSDVFTFEQPHARSHPRHGATASCSFDAAPFFASPFVDVIHQQHAAEQARAEAIQRAKAAQRRRAQQQRQQEQERDARAYLAHLLELQQREELVRRQQEAQRQYQLRQHQLHLQRQRQREEAAAREEYRRRQQFAEYQRRKAHAIEQERRRIAAIKEAENRSRSLFLALEDLIFGGFDLGSSDEEFNHDEPVAEPSRSPQPAAAPIASTTPTTASQDVKGKAKAIDDDGDESMDAALDTLLGPGPESAKDTTDISAPTAGTAIDEDPEEVGPSPQTTTEQPTTSNAAGPAASSSAQEKKDILVFSHPFTPGSSNAAKAVQASDIKVSVNEQTNKVTVAGLWDNRSAPSSPALSAARPGSPSPSTSSRKGRSRSPKRARVSDVDANGDEIVRNDDEDEEEVDDFVKLPSPASSSSGSATPVDEQPAKVEKTFALPPNAKAEDLRAELTDEGLRLWISTQA